MSELGSLLALCVWCFDHCRSYDEYDVIDWSDVANDGWGSSSSNSSSSNGGSRRQCCNTQAAGSSSAKPRAWGSSMCRAGCLPSASSSMQQQQQRRVAAAAAGDGTHSVDTYEDSLLPPGGYEGADAADDALCRPDSPLCNDPMHSVDSTEVEDWGSQPNQGFGSSSSTAPAAAGSSSSASTAGSDATHSVDTYEDSLLPSGGYEGADADDALCRPDSPLCNDPMHSVDSTEIIDWSQQGSSSSSSSSRTPVVAAAAGESRGGNRAGEGTHSVDTYEDALAPAGGYEGADADDALCRPDSPLCEDPSHSVDNTEVIDWGDQPSSDWGQQQAASAAAGGSSSVSAAAAEPAASSSSLPADPSSRKKPDKEQQQQQQKVRRPYMNIVGGRWVPPSREESEAMMRGSYDMGPDEGV
jgi:hypothetical protein